MRTIELEVFKFDELSDKAKEKARDWYRQAGMFDAEFVYEDAARMARLMGIDLERTRVTLMGGGHAYKPTIYWSGFSSQGDGCCWEGVYEYAKGAVKAIKAEYNDEELIRIAKGLQDVQRKHFYKLTASSVHRGHYYHSGCMQVEVRHSEDEYRDIGDAEGEVTQLLRDFADWIYEQLEAEWDYQNSDETVDENMVCNSYEFYADGGIA